LTLVRTRVFLALRRADEMTVQGMSGDQVAAELDVSAATLAKSSADHCRHCAAAFRAVVRSEWN
jgi:hypothetical protein